MNKAANRRVTVIIPTLAEQSRRDGLLRAIESVLRQSATDALPLVVVNGGRFDPQLRAELEHRTDIRFLYRDEACLPAACAEGVRFTDTDFFSFLDDDDLYTPDALSHRLSLIEKAPAPDLVVTNFYIDRDGDRIVAHPDFESLSGSPRDSIFEFAWLASLNGLYRTASFSAADFAASKKYMEWTSLAIRIADTKSIRFTDRPTAVYCDGIDSLSKTSEYVSAAVELMSSVSRGDYPVATRRLINRKRAAGQNELAQRAMRAGDRRSAWRHHLRCIATPGGWRYAGFTRKLL